MSVSVTETMAATPAAMAMPEITIYHLEGRRSERIVWLMEELGLPYTLKFKQGDLAGSMAPIRAINPEMPVAPTVTRTQASSGNSFWTVPTRSLTWLTLSVISLDSSAVILMATTFSMPLAPSTTGTPTK